MRNCDLIKEFEENYPKTEKDNKKMMCVRRIIELENKTGINYVERTELENLKRKVKKM